MICWINESFRGKKQLLTRCPSKRDPRFDFLYNLTPLSNLGSELVISDEYHPSAHIIYLPSKVFMCRSVLHLISTFITDRKQRGGTCTWSRTRVLFTCVVPSVGWRYLALTVREFPPLLNARVHRASVLSHPWYPSAGGGALVPFVGRQSVI